MRVYIFTTELLFYSSVNNEDTCTIVSNHKCAIASAICKPHPAAALANYIDWPTPLLYSGRRVTMIAQCIYCLWPCFCLVLPCYLTLSGTSKAAFVLFSSLLARNATNLNEALFMTKVGGT